MKTLRTLKKSPNAPDINSVWLYKGTMKYFNNGEWETIGGGVTSVDWDDITNKPDFATVATSGSYNDLSDKPTIPPAYTLPAATISTIGGVKKATNVDNLATGAELATVVTKVNAILSALKVADIMVEDAN